MIKKGMREMLKLFYILILLMVAQRKHLSKLMKLNTKKKFWILPYVNYTQGGGTFVVFNISDDILFAKLVFMMLGTFHCKWNFKVYFWLTMNKAFPLYKLKFSTLNTFYLEIYYTSYVAYELSFLT